MRRLLLALAGIIILAAVALVAFLLTFDVNRYKGDIVELVRQHTRRTFEIAGDLRLELSLIPTISVEGVRLGNAAWSPRKEMITVRRFEARAALVPLLRRRIEIRHLAITGAEVMLERNTDGTGNWVIDAGKAPAPAAGFPAFDLRDVALDDTVIHYHPGGNGKEQTIRIDHLSASTQGLRNPIAVDVRAGYNGAPVALRSSIASVATLLADQPYAVEVAATLGAASVTVRGGIAKPLSGGGLNVDVGVTADSLAALGRTAGADLPALAPAALSANVAGAAGRYSLTGLDTRLGHSRFTGKAVIDLTAGKPNVSAQLQAPLVDLTEVLPPPAKAGKNERVFSIDPIRLDGIAAMNGTIDFDLGRVRTRKLELTAVRGVAVLKDGQLTLEPLQMGLTGGQLGGRLRIASSGHPGVALDADLRITGLVPAQLPQFAGKNPIDGGRTDLTVALRGAGQSLAGIMGTANGRLVVKVGPGTLKNKAANVAGTDILDGLRLLNPLAASDPDTRLQCAVANFDIRNGVAATRTGIALQTDKLNVLGGGTIDLKTEGIDVGAKPKPRRGVGINLAGLTDFVRLGGTLADPRPVTDAAGAATAGLKVGTAVATGGLSLLAEGLFDRATGDEDVCAIALGEKPLPKARQASTPQAAPAREKSVIEKTTETTRDAVKGAGDAVKGVFKGLFGK